MAGQKVFKSTKCTYESESSDIDSSRPSSSRSVTPAPSFSLQCHLISSCLGGPQSVGQNAFSKESVGAFWPDFILYVWW